MVFREVDPNRSYVTVLQFKEHVDSFGGQVDVLDGRVDELESLPKVEARKRTSSEAVASGSSWHVLTFPDGIKNEDTDLFGYDSGKIVAKKAMLMELKADNTFGSNSTGQREIKIARYDSSDTFIEEGGTIRHDAASSGGHKQSTSFAFVMDEGDYLQVEVRQTSGGSLASNRANYLRECRRLD